MLTRGNFSGRETNLRRLLFWSGNKLAGYEKYIKERVVSRRTKTSQHPDKESEQPPESSPLWKSSPLRKKLHHGYCGGRKEERT